MSTKSSNQTLSAFGVQHVFKGVGRYTNYILDKGEGCWVTTAPESEGFADELAQANGTSEEGRRLLDFTSGIGVTNLGHCHPKVTEAICKQAAKMVHAQVNIGFSRPYLELIRALKPVMPDPSLDSFFFWNSGAEAVEAAIKLARMATKKQNIIVMQGGYHGRTFGTMALTRSKTVYGAGYAPLMPGVFSTPFPYWHQFGFSSPAEAEKCPIDLSEQALYQLELVLAQQTAGSDTAAILIEPVLGEGGYVPATKKFFEGLRKICDREGILLIADEVQTGFGRTGTYFAMENIAPGVVPDVMIFAKGIANGLPLSGVVTRKELSDRQTAGSQGGTYAGNAVACAAAIACAEIMKNDGILENVAARSKQLVTALEKLRNSPTTGSLFVDIRPLGLMVGVEFAAPPSLTSVSNNKQDLAKIPEKIASRVQAKCLEKGMLTLTTSIYQTIRFIPPLIISEEEMDIAIKIFSEACEEVAKEG